MPLGTLGARPLVLMEQTVRELAEVGIECEPIRVDDYTGKKMTSSMTRMDCRWSCMNNHGREKTINPEKSAVVGRS